MTEYRIDHVHLKALDVEATARWYVEMLGARITFEGAFKGSLVRYVEIGRFRFIVFGLVEGETGAEAPLPPSLQARFGVDHFGFVVDNLREAVEELRAKGVRILEEPWSPRAGLTICYIEGPDQVRIELAERK